MISRCFSLSERYRSVLLQFSWAHGRSFCCQQVLGYMPNGRAKCRFPKGLFALQPHSLVRTSPPPAGTVINGGLRTASAASVARPTVVSAATTRAVTESRRDFDMGSRHVLLGSREGLDLVSDPLVSTTSTPTNNSRRRRRPRTTRSCEPVLGARSIARITERGSADAAHGLSTHNRSLFLMRPFSVACSADSSGSSYEWDSTESSSNCNSRSSNSSIGSNSKSNHNNFIKYDTRARTSHADSGRPQDLRVRSLDSVHCSVQGLRINDSDCRSSCGHGIEVEHSSRASNEGTGCATAVTVIAGSSVALTPMFEIGDVVSWKGADSDLPRGTLGTVSKLHNDGDVEATFGVRRRQQTFTFAAHRLILEKPRASTSTAPHTARSMGNSTVLSSRSSSLSPNVSIHRKRILPGARVRKRSSSADCVAWDLLAPSSSASSISPPKSSGLCLSNDRPIELSPSRKSSLPLHPPQAPEQLQAEIVLDAPLLVPKMVAPLTSPRTEKREESVSIMVNFAQPFGMHLGRQSLRVYAVQAGSQAEACGIATGWRCTAVGSQPVTDLDSFKAEVSQAKARMASLAAVQVAAAACAHGAAAEDYDDEGHLLPIPAPSDTSAGTPSYEETLRFAVPLVMHQNQRWVDEEEMEQSVQGNRSGASHVETNNQMNLSASFKPAYSPTTVMASATTPTSFAAHNNAPWQSSSSSSLPQLVGSPLHNTYREVGEGATRADDEIQHGLTRHRDTGSEKSGAPSISQEDHMPAKGDPSHGSDNIEVTPEAEAAYNHADCVICLEPLTQEAACLLPCRHSFHVACVAGLRAAGVSQACPMCRAALPPGPDQLCDEATWRYTKYTHVENMCSH